MPSPVKQSVDILLEVVEAVVFWIFPGMILHQSQEAKVEADMGRGM